MVSSNDPSIKGDPVTSRRPSKIIIDTNALLMPFQFNINLDLELDRLFVFWELIVPGSVLEELEGMRDRERFARPALKLAAKYETRPVSAGGDDGVLEALEREGGSLLTNDKVLRKRALKRGYKVIFLRNKGHLTVSDRG